VKILFAQRQFGKLTGAELYSYELGRELVRLGHEFTISAPVFDPGILVTKALEAGIKLAEFKTINSHFKFDVMHLNEPRATNYFLGTLQATPAVATIHSQWPCEQPVLSPRIQKYICIREDIREKIVCVDKIPVEKTQVIPNGVDFARFHPGPRNASPGNRVLMVGTLDILRRPTMADLAARARKGEIEFWLCGLNLHPAQNPMQVFGPTAYFTPKWAIELLLMQCDQTAGIMLGRTTIEGWAMGLPGWIYDVDLKGNIISKALHQPPADIQQFNIQNVAQKIFQIYKEVAG
jgi:glycosyltransferase involved in cell wall biosynthesis